MTTPELVIFDLDGVLIDSKELHFEALNEALREIDSKFEISHSNHSTKYDGLSTRRKLEMLHSEKGFPLEHFEKVWKLKQDITLRMLGEIKRDEELISFMVFLQNQGIKLAVASNAVRNTIDLVLRNLGIIDFFSLILSNENVKSTKPHPEIYWKTMMHFEVVPDATVIFEDSYVGRLAALRSGARLIPIENRRDLTWQRIRQVDLSSSTLMPVKRPWKSDKLNVLIPMAGAGSRFEAAGYTFPKPLIEVRGKPMIQVVVESLNIDAKYIYIVQRSHFEKYNLDYLLKLITPNCEIVQIEGLTEGAACTTLLAREFIDNQESLVIANSDQFVEWNSGETLYSFMADGIDGGIVTFKATHPKWSYARIDESGIVREVAEKKPISDIATVGIYFWKKGSDYVKYADEMIEKNIRTNGEFYVCPVFNQAIEDGKKFRIRNIDQMWGLGTPEDLNYFLENHN
jgi:beta-phosphoglucomutase-like phosphatase (HAD superfamily)/dTDP-glucose pyrophosphorylase